MTTELDADDLGLLRDGFTAVFEADDDPVATDAALADLGWHDLLASTGSVALAPLFGAAGAAGRLSGALDDVVAGAGLGLHGETVSVVHPIGTAPSGRVDGDRLVVDGVVTRRVERCNEVVVALNGRDGRAWARVDTAHLAVEPAALDPTGNLRRISGQSPIPASADGSWPISVVAARLALSHHLLASARWMLQAAVEHALGRHQFGRPIASFQAVRHKLAETLVAIEGAQAVVDAVPENPLGAALSKSLAGNAARIAAKHAQQVLAGIGFTTDHPFQQRMKLTMAVDALYGSAGELPTEIGHLLAAQGGAPRIVEL